MPLFSSSRTSAEAARREELSLWLLKTSFHQLPSAGHEEFSKFLSPANRRRLEFYTSSSRSLTPAALSSYILDGENMLKDVAMEEDAKHELLQKAKEVDKVVSDLRAKMEPDLNSEFAKFKEALRKEMSKLPNK